MIFLLKPPILQDFPIATFDYQRVSPWSTCVVIVAVVTIFGCLVEGNALQIPAPSEGVGRSNPLNGSNNFLLHSCAIESFKMLFSSGFTG